MAGKFGAEHGAFLPEGVTWTTVDGEGPHGNGFGDHHQVWLMLARPGFKYRKRILLGEVRRRSRKRMLLRYWRAFPEGSLTEFPKEFPSHFKALTYLKECWEAGVHVEVPRGPGKDSRPAAAHGTDQGPASAEDAPSWAEFFGKDLWDDIAEG